MLYWCFRIWSCCNYVNEYESVLSVVGIDCFVVIVVVSRCFWLCYFCVY